jgi:hypothetical protein
VNRWERLKQKFAGRIVESPKVDWQAVLEARTKKLYLSSAPKAPHIPLIRSGRFEKK